MTKNIKKIFTLFLALTLGGVSLVACKNQTVLDKFGITPNEYTIAVGESIQLEPSITFKEEVVETKYNELVEELNIAYRSDNNNIAKVDKNGLVKGIGAGVTNIKMITGNASFTVKVTVVPALTDIKVDSNVTLVEEGTYQLKATFIPENAKTEAITYVSKDTTIATVNESGLITAIKYGETVITVTSGNVSKEVKVTVEPKIEDITLNATEGILYVGNTHNIKATLTPESVEAKIVWSSSDENVATVAENGTVTAKAVGTATITATVEGTEIKADYALTIQNQPSTGGGTKPPTGGGGGTNPPAGGSGGTTPPTGGGGGTPPPTPPTPPPTPPTPPPTPPTPPPVDGGDGVYDPNNGGGDINNDFGDGWD